jgi:hypothetical protein
MRPLRLFVSLFALDALEDLFTVYCNFSRSVHTKSDLITFDTKNSHGDIITNDYRFTHAPSQDQHSQTPSRPCAVNPRFRTFLCSCSIGFDGRPSAPEPFIVRLATGSRDSWNFRG